MKKNTLIVIMFAVIIIGLGVALYMLNSQSGDIKNLNDRISSQNYEHARLLTCYTNNIHPCDDASIKAWNDKNPEDAFNLTARQ